MVQSYDGQLIVERFGAFVGKHSERVRVSVKGEVIEERPLLGLEHVFVLSSGVSLSSDLIRECAERGIMLTFLSGSGQPYAQIIAPELTGTVRTRREQLLAYLDERGVAVAKAFAAGKMQNQAALLKYMAKYRKARDPALYERVRLATLDIQDRVQDVQRIEAACVDDVRVTIMNLEAQAAKVYWETARELLIPDVGWEGRVTRGAEDIVNSSLNYGYGILYSHVQRAIILAGLDPFAGFLHADRSGKPSLVLDLIEEFRQQVVDRTIFGLLNRGVSIEVEDGRLTEASRRLLAEKIRERLEGEEPHEGRKQKLRNILQVQARHLATFLRGEAPLYRPFVGRW